MSSRNVDEVWYVHAPLKKEDRPVVNAPPPSNIPYINGVFDEEIEVIKAQTVWFKNTDSDFVRLSKLGGRQDLLVHAAKERSKEPVGYPRPTWWVDMLTETGEQKNDSQDEKYVFKVPAWFAHQDKSQNANENTERVSPNYPYLTDDDYKKNPQKFAPIEEPVKYGQIRNYLNPVKVKVDSTQYKRNEPIKQTSSMNKIISNEYEKERPKDYQDWKKEKKPNNLRPLKK